MSNGIDTVECIWITKGHSLIHERWKTLTSLPSIKFLYLCYISTSKDELLNNYSGWMNTTRLFISLISSTTGGWLPVYNTAAGLCAMKRAYYTPKYSTSSGRIFIKFEIQEFFKNMSSKIQVSLKSDKNKRYFTRRPMYHFYHISLNSCYT